MIVANFLMRAVTTDVEKGVLRIAVGQGSVDPEKRLSRTQVVPRILTGHDVHTLQPGREKRTAAPWPQNGLGTIRRLPESLTDFGKLRTPVVRLTSSCT